MNAYRILLTHFSQRYPKIPIFDSKYEDRISIASDWMTVNLKDLEHIPKILPPLRCLFKELEDEEKQREEVEKSRLVEKEKNNAIKRAKYESKQSKNPNKKKKEAENKENL